MFFHSMHTYIKQRRERKLASSLVLRKYKHDTNLVLNLHESIPSGFKLTRGGLLSFPANHSALVRVGSQITRVRGNRSSWNKSV